jgi:cation/acetate symporter
MLAGLCVTLYYLLTRQAGAPLWFGVQAGSAGVFGVPIAFAVMAVVSLFTPASPQGALWVQTLRRP